MLFRRGAMQVFGDRLMRRRLARQDEVAAHPMDGLGGRLTGEEIVAQVYWPEARHAGPCRANQRFAAFRSQSCFSAPSWGAMNSGGSGRTWCGPAQRWKRPGRHGSIRCRRRSAAGSSSARNGSCANRSAPSRPARSASGRRAVGTVRVAPSVSIALKNSGSNAAGEAPSSIRRI